jgi:DNA mismatch repair ATPase MutS
MSVTGSVAADSLLELTITYKGVGHCCQVGVSKAALESTVSAVRDAGYKVGVIEQESGSSQAASSKGKSKLVMRRLVGVQSPATMLDPTGHNPVHLLALYADISCAHQPFAKASCGV